MNKKQTILLIVAIALITLGITPLIYSATMTDTISKRVDFVVSDAVSFNLNQDTINFGGGPAPITVTRSIILKTNYSAFYAIQVSPELEGIVYPKYKWSGYLEEGVPKDIPLILSVPPGYPKGDHSGMLYIKLIRRLW